MPDILIGNIRGPQGATGPANTLLASVYQFCASDSGATIPQEGLWTSGVPQIEKGKYIWCRNILTWDSGPETILYSVGYVGNDGDFSGIEIVNELGDRVSVLEDRVTPISKGGTESSTLTGAQAKLGITELQTAIEKLKAVATESANGMMSKEDKKRLDTINDETTGINLLRGTRDFVKGAVQYKSSSFFVDGFIYANSQVTVSTDAEGYGVIKLNKVGSGNTQLNSSVVIDYKAGDWYTACFDYMFDDVSGASATTQEVAIFGESEPDSYTTSRTTFKVDMSNVKAGVWYKAVIHYRCDNDQSVNRFLRLDTYLWGGGAVTSINIRKCCVYKGQINNPIWSASPFDTNYINDETTGINLLRGTRDFVLGSTTSTKLSTVSTDGFKKSGTATVDYIKDGEGFTNAHSVSTSSTTLSTIAFESALEPLETITYSFEFKPVNIANLNTDIASVAIYNGSYIARQLFSITPANVNTFRLNEWNQAVLTIQVPQTFNSSSCIAYGTIRFPEGSEIYFRKCAVYKGFINHPVWSASPFDVASSTLEKTSLTARNDISGTVNLNELVDPGIYTHYGDSCTGQPQILNNYFCIAVLRSGGNGLIQIAGDSSGNLVMRGTNDYKNLANVKWRVMSTTISEFR